MFIIFPSLLPSRLVCHPSASADPESSQVHMDNRKMGTERFLQLLSFLQLFNHFGFFSGNNFKALIQDLRYLEGGWLGSVHPETSSTSVKLVRLHREGGFPGGSVVKESTCNRGDLRDADSIPVGKIPWGRKGPLTPAFLPGKSHGERSLVGYSQWSHQESYTTERVSTHACKEWTLIFFFLFRLMTPDRKTFKGNNYTPRSLWWLDQNFSQ